MFEETTQYGTDFRLFLQSEFIRRCKKNQRYSLSAYARYLNMDVSTLAKILKGQRPIRKNAIRKLAIRFSIPVEQIRRFENSSPRTNAKSKLNKTDEVDSNYQQLTLDAFQVISDWYHFAILELMLLPHFQNNQKWIAKVLQISPEEVRIAVERLIRLEMIRIDAKGKWTDLTGGKISTIGKISNSEPVAQLQRQVLDKARLALDDVPFERRSQTSITSAIDPSKIPEARKMIIDFQRKLCKFLRTENSRNFKEVYNLSVSLYPISNTETNHVSNKRKKEI